MLGIKLAAAVLVLPFVQNAQDFENFEAASIKISPPPDRTQPPHFGCTGGPGTTDPGLYRCDHATLQSLIIEAFTLSSLQVPYSALADHTAYDLNARVVAGATRPQFRSMLQRLLKERFELAYHFEKRPSRVYDLVVAAGGLKMKSAAPEDTPFSRERDEYGFLPPPADYRGTSTQVRGGVVHWVARQATLDQLAHALESRIAHPVTNATGVVGAFDFSVNFASANPEPPRAAKTVGSPDDAQMEAAPSLTEILQKRLGLRLVSKEGFIEVFVIDHAAVKPIDK